MGLTGEVRTVALAGNPNVGKSTVFNALTGLKQHTGNWPGKTVAAASGAVKTPRHNVRLVDVPGAYSLLAHSPEEEVARDFLCFGGADAVVVVCDAASLERNLNLALQTLEVAGRVVVCVNLLDEAEKAGIKVDLGRLEGLLGVPVVGVCARNAATLEPLLETLDNVLEGPPCAGYEVAYPSEICVARDRLAGVLPGLLGEKYDFEEKYWRWLALRLLENDEKMLSGVEMGLGCDLRGNSAIKVVLSWAEQMMARSAGDGGGVSDEIAAALVGNAAQISAKVCRQVGENRKIDGKLDGILTGKHTAYPIMLLMLLGVFWLTIVGANYPSALLAAVFARVGDFLVEILAGAPPRLAALLIDGVWRTVSWVVAVMLPPMAIFFPLFTLLEDVGYLPRVAYNLDKPLHHCRACGKQALTICMGFGCNAAGVVGCRIIDAPRERLLAVLTNSLVPCNGRFPTLISLLLMFFVGAGGGWLAGLAAAALLTGLIVCAVAATLLATRVLSVTVLKGEPSAFALELPHYRRPQIVSTLVRSLLDRTIFVLGRAIMAAAPAGAVIWLLANVTVEGGTLLAQIAAWLDPVAGLLGLDGVILLAFVLGLPANEIVVPIMLMCYLAEGTLVEAAGLAQMRAVLVASGWTWLTALSVLIFMLFHWPCATTLLTIRKETGSLKWTALAAALPTMIGVGLCVLVNVAARLIM